MPLVKATLKSSLQNLCDNKGADVSSCAQLWASAVGGYGAAVVPATTAATVAQTTLQGALASAFPLRPDCAAALETAFLAYATTLGAGMIGPGFSAFVPPAAPVGFASLFAGAKPATNAEAADAFASAIDTWLKTGTATPIPSGPPVTWS